MKNSRDNTPLEIIFETPRRFGLRGDDELWQWLKESLSLRWKDKPFDSSLADAIRKDLNDFGIDVRSSGHPAPDEIMDDTLYIKAFDKAGRHAEISVTWWRETGYPLLISRIAEQQIDAKWLDFTNNEMSESISQLINDGKLEIK